MATTSLWRVHGSIGKVLDYAGNEEKTVTAKEKFTGDSRADSVTDVIDYISRDSATEARKLVSGIGCHPETAKEEMMRTKRNWERTGGVIAYHGYQSFAEGEVTPEVAHAIGKKLAEELWGGRFEVLIATHVDKASHIHNHFVINTVSFKDGKKFFRSAKDYLNMQRVSDRLCKEYGLSVIEHPKGRGKNYGEWSAERKGELTHRNMIRRDIDAAVRASMTKNHFFEFLKNRGYDFKLYTSKGKPLERPSLRPKGAERYFRFDGLGEGYSMEEITERIYSNKAEQTPFSAEAYRAMSEYRKKNHPKKKHTGLAALYYYYCYELGIIRKYPESARQISFFMREDLRKMEKLEAQTRFLAANNIETIDDLNSYKQSAEEKLREHSARRQELRNRLKRQIRNGSPAMQDYTKQIISGETKIISKLRKETDMCREIEERSAGVKKEMRLLENDKEKEMHYVR